MLYLAFSLCVKATIVVVVGILWATYNNVKKPVSAKTGGRKKDLFSYQWCCTTRNHSFKAIRNKYYSHKLWHPWNSSVTGKTKPSKNYMMVEIIIIIGL